MGICDNRGFGWQGKVRLIRSKTVFNRRFRWWTLMKSRGSKQGCKFL